MIASKRIGTTAVLLLIGFFSHYAVAEKSLYFSRLGIAIEGYDPVAYFTESEARLGSSEYSYEWMGTTWHFVSAAHRDAFAAEPERYAPQYGGYCALAASQNYVFETDPGAFTLYKGKLYLNAGFGTRVRWSLDKEGNIAKADKNWPELKKDLL